MDFLVHHFFELTVGGLVVGSIYGLVALGYTMVYGVLQLINFAHSEVFMYGTYGAAWVFMIAYGPTSTNKSLVDVIPLLLLALLAAMAMSGAVALLLERVAYRPLIKRNSPKLVALISAIGASFALSETMGLRDRLPTIVSVLIMGAIAVPASLFIFRQIPLKVRGEEGSVRAALVGIAVFAGCAAVTRAVFNVSGLRSRLDSWIGPARLTNYVNKPRDVYSSPVQILPHKLFTIGDYQVTDVDLLIVFSAILMMIALDAFVRRTRMGRSIRAVAQDPESAALMGVNSTRVVQLTFLIGGLMAGVAATLYIVKYENTRPGAGFNLGVRAFTAAVMGGIGNLRGALLGGLILGVAENWSTAFLENTWSQVVSFVLLILVLLFRPTGILGEALGKARA